MLFCRHPEHSRREDVPADCYFVDTPSTADEKTSPQSYFVDTPSTADARRRARRLFCRHPEHSRREDVHWRITGAITRPVSLQCARRLFCRHPEHGRREDVPADYFADAPSTADEDCFGECGSVCAPSTAEEDRLCFPCTPPVLSSSRCCRGTPLVPAAGTLGPDSVRLAEGAGGLLVDAPPLLNLSSADWCASIGVDRERRVQMRNPAEYSMG